MKAAIQPVRSLESEHGQGDRLHWPDIVPLDAAATPDFPPDIFTGAIGEMVEAVARATETPPELAGSFALAVLSTVCQKRFIVEPEPGYIETLSLWLVSALPPANRKTAVQGKMIAPLTEWERDQVEMMGEQIHRALSNKLTQEERIKELRKKAAKANAEDYPGIQAELEELEAQPVHVPVAPRLITQDVTPEHLGEMMAENEERMAIISDEGGIFEIIAGLYAGGRSNLDLFLKSHSGSDVRVDRRSRPPIRMDSAALSMGLAIQPDVLNGLSEKQGFRGQGFLARILFTLPVSMVGHRKLEPNPVPVAVERTYRTVIRNLLEVPPGIDDRGHPRPYTLQLSDTAYAAWKEFQRQVETQMRAGHCFDHLKDWAGKLPGAVIRIAGVLHCAELGASWRGQVVADQLRISGEVMRQAINLGEIFSQHALIIFDQMGMDDDVSAARKIWAWVEGRSLLEFTRRDCQRELRSFTKSIQLTQPLHLLTERGYIQRVQARQSGPGRKSEVYQVNPRLSERWM